MGSQAGGKIQPQGLQGTEPHKTEARQAAGAELAPCPGLQEQKQTTRSNRTIIFGRQFGKKYFAAEIPLLAPCLRRLPLRRGTGHKYNDPSHRLTCNTDGWRHPSTCQRGWIKNHAVHPEEDVSAKRTVWGTRGPSCESAAQWYSLGPRFKVFLFIAACGIHSDLSLDGPYCVATSSLRRLGYPGPEQAV